MTPKWFYFGGGLNSELKCGTCLSLALKYKHVSGNTFGK